MKALILSGGRGVRLKPLTNTIAKQLLPVANKPILYYILEQITAAGVNDIGIVVSPETGEKIEEAVGDGSYWNAKITYILQPKPLGLAHAVKTAQDFLVNSPFILFLGDNLIEDEIKNFVEEFNQQSPDALILLKETSTPHLFGIAELDKLGKVSRLVEKPKEPKSNLAIVGVYLLTSEIHQAIAQIKPSRRGELEVTDAIQKLIDMGGTVQSHILTGWWLDIGKKDDLLEANRVVLEGLLQPSIKGEVSPNSQVMGRVEIREGASVENSIIRGPLSLAEGCRVKDSVIGPFTSIAAKTVIEHSCIERSVILEGCSISNIELLEDSVIGRCAKVIGLSRNVKVARFFVGDYERVEL